MFLLTTTNMDVNLLLFSNREDTSYIRTPTTVIGSYYFEEYLQSHSWFQPPEPQKFQSLPFCLMGGKRAVQSHQLTKFDSVTSTEGLQRYHAALVHTKGHVLVKDERSGPAIKVRS